MRRPGALRRGAVERPSAFHDRQRSLDGVPRVVQAASGAWPDGPAAAAATTSHRGTSTSATAAPLPSSTGSPTDRLGETWSSGLSMRPLLQKTCRPSEPVRALGS